MNKLYIIFLLLTSVNGFSQMPLIPYRDGKYWGLADTLGVIKVSPVYDAIETPTYIEESTQLKQRYNAKDIFVVKRDGKYGLLSHATVLMPTNYSQLYVDSTFITENKRAPGAQYIQYYKVIYNLKGQPLITDSITSVSEIINYSNSDKLYCVHGENNNCGVFWYDPKQQKIIQWIINGKRDISIGDYSKGFIEAIIITTEKTGPHTFADTKQDMDILFDPAAKKYVLKQSTNPLKWGRLKREYNSGDSKSTFVLPKGNPLLRFIKFELNGKNVLEIRKDQRFQGHTAKIDTVHFKPQADTIMLENYYFYGHNSPRAPTTIPPFTGPLIDKIDTGIRYDNYVAFKRNGKSGLIAEDVIIPPLYNDLVYFYPGTIDRPIFITSIISKGGKLKWGVINSQNKIILPFIYDQINKIIDGGRYLLLKKDNLYGLSDNHGKIVLPVVYDSILPGNVYHSFTMVYQGKYGYFNDFGLSCKPIFPYKINRLEVFNNYTVFELVDDSNKLMGYADKKGFLFFKQ